MTKLCLFTFLKGKDKNVWLVCRTANFSSGGGWSAEWRMAAMFSGWVGAYTLHPHFSLPFPVSHILIMFSGMSAPAYTLAANGITECCLNVYFFDGCI